MMTNSTNKATTITISWTGMVVHRIKKIQKKIKGKMIKPCQCDKSLVIVGKMRLPLQTSNKVMEGDSWNSLVAKTPQFSRQRLVENLPISGMNILLVALHPKNHKQEHHLKHFVTVAIQIVMGIVKHISILIFNLIRQ